VAVFPVEPSVRPLVPLMMPLTCLRFVELRRRTSLMTLPASNRAEGKWDGWCGVRTMAVSPLVK